MFTLISLVLLFMIYGIMVIMMAMVDGILVMMKGTVTGKMGYSIFPARTISGSSPYPKPSTLRQQFLDPNSGLNDKLIFMFNIKSSCFLLIKVCNAFVDKLTTYDVVHALITSIDYFHEYPQT